MKNLILTISVLFFCTAFMHAQDVERRYLNQKKSKRSDIQLKRSSSEDVIAASPAIYVNELIVNNGSGGGDYKETDTVSTATITADAPPEGKKFKEWTGDIQYVADPKASSTTVYVAERRIVVTATYEIFEPGWTVLFSDDFESGFGNWNDGGEDCRRLNNATYANSGSYSIELRDNNVTGSISTNALDLSESGEVKVEFSYYVRSFDNNREDFWLQVSTDGGSTFTTIEKWNRNDDFQNGERKNDEVIITQSFTANTVLRFRCDASGNSDWLYLDDIVVSIKGEVTTSPEYNLTVNNGSGDGKYRAGESVDIQADAPPAGQVFDIWTGDVAYVEDVGDETSQVAMPAKDVTVTATYIDENTLTYRLTVNGGSGSGRYLEGEQVTITAATDCRFRSWLGDIQYIDDYTRSPAIITMPPMSITVTAECFGEFPKYKLTVNNGSGDGEYYKEAYIRISADAPPSGQVFDQWIGDVQYLSDAGQSSTYVTIPEQAVTVTATYKDDNPGPVGTIVMRAKGYCVGDNMELRINDVAVGSWTMTKKYSNYTYTGNVSGNIKVAFTNGNSGGCSRRFFLDYIKVDGTTYQTERTATRVGKGSGQRLDENGHFDFGSLKSEHGIKKLSNQNFTCYPNPATDILYIGAKGHYNLSLINLSGQVVKHTALYGNATLNLDDVSKGMYIVKINKDNNVKIEKLYIK